jgi:ABC-2 type transport system ATP-binding protein
MASDTVPVLNPPTPDGALAPAAAAVPAIVRAEHLSKWYGQVNGLNDVTVSIPPGITGLLGPNGAGKSTFMKLMTGQLKPSQGTIRVLGHSLWDSPEAFARIGFCPEQDAFYDRMTGLEWITALVRLNGFGDAEARDAASRAIDLVDLTDAAGKKIGAYSKGMRQRIKLAQALVHDPDILILDEPLTGMDPLQRRKTIRLVKDWARRGRHVVVSSHILHEIEAMTSNILLITNGRILAEGNVHQIRELIDTHPHTVHIRASDPRALAAHLLKDDGVTKLSFEDGALVVETRQPDAFYRQMTELAASGTVGVITEVTSPDDNLQAVFKYLVRQ